MAATKVLIVEDDKALIDMYKTKFEREGFEVHTCENGLDAVKRISEILPDIVFLDIMMPGYDGFYALEVIKKFVPGFTGKILVFSNLNDADTVEKAKSLGADGFIVKANVTPREAVEIARKTLAA